jgi:hypothetical protein
METADDADGADGNGVPTLLSGTKSISLKAAVEEGANEGNH